MLIKIIKSQRDIVAVCDSELIGKKFEEGKLQIDVKENFFRGEEVDEQKAMDIMEKMAREDATFYIVGEKSIQAALEVGVIAEEGIISIQGIPVSLVLL
ncbi:Uncharacterised protein [uncultured archaeon]|nr:Uncharacterised protein [uncultured archaeon]